jgi:hypothetical protein
MSERSPQAWLDDMCHGDYGGDELYGYDEALAAWEADRSRIATLESRIAALVPLARWGWEDLAGSDSTALILVPTCSQLDAAADVLAAIAVEQTTTTGGQSDE